MANVKEGVNSLEDKSKVYNATVSKSKESVSPSGSENGEKPVREKFKKADLEEANAGSTLPTSAPNGDAVKAGSGKLKKKRSYEGLKNEEEVEQDTTSETAHTRKKTREGTSSTKKGKDSQFLRESKVTSEDLEEAKHSDAESDKIITTPPSSGDEIMIDSTGTNMIKKKLSSQGVLGSQDDMAISPKASATDADRGRRSTSTPVSDNDYNAAGKLKTKRSSEEMLGSQDDMARSSKVAATDAERERRSSSLSSSVSGSSYKSATNLKKKRNSKKTSGRKGKAISSPKFIAVNATHSDRSPSESASDDDDLKTKNNSKKRSLGEISDAQDGVSKSSKVAATDAERSRRSSSSSSSASQSGNQSKCAHKIQRKRSSEEMLGSQDDVSKSPKVAATDIERNRRSASAPSSDDDSQARDTNTKAAIKSDPPRSVPQEVVSTKDKASIIPATSGFANTSSISPFAALSSKKIAPSSEPLPQTSSSAFAGSGFAALAGSNSPFGSLPKPKTASAESNLSSSTSAFASSGFASSGFASSGFASSGFASSGFASLSGTSSPFASSIGDSKLTPSSTASPFAATTSKSVFGGTSIFGSSLGGGFGGPNKLSSFAAPVQDSKVNQQPAKPFGAPEVSDNDEEGEDGDDTTENEYGDEDDAGASVVANGAEASTQYKIQNGKHFPWFISRGGPNSTQLRLPARKTSIQLSSHRMQSFFKRSVMDGLIVVQDHSDSITK